MKKFRLIPLAMLLALAASASWLWNWGRGSHEFLLARLAFEYELLVGAAELEKEARSGSSQAYYFTSYHLNGLLSAYEATGDERILRRAFKLMDPMLASTEDFQEGGRTYRVWGPYSVLSDHPAPRPNLHFTFQAAVPFARAAAIVRDDLELGRRHGERADRYFRFVDGVVFDYFHVQTLASRLPWLSMDDFPHWNDNASNLALNAAFLCRAGGRKRHCDMAKLIGAVFKTKLRTYKSGWIWENQTIPIGSDTDNTPGSVGNQAGVPDVSHTNREAFLMLTLHEMGILFSRADMERMAGTLTGLIWDGREDEPSFANYINGNDEAYRVYKTPGLNGSVYHGWALMGAYSPEARSAMLSLMLAIYRGKMNGAIERNKTSYGGALALAGHTLRGFGVRVGSRGRSSAYR